MAQDLTTIRKARPPQAHRARVSDAGRTVLDIPKVRKFLEHMLLGEKLADAALAAGLRASRARRLMADPVVRREFLRRCELLSEGEKARNHLLLTTIRDRGMQAGASAAQQKVSVEAARLMSGEAERAGTTNIYGPTVIAGYVIKLPSPGEGPRQIGRQPPSRVAEDV